MLRCRFRCFCLFRLGSDLGFSARDLSFEILLYLVEIIIMLLDLSYVEMYLIPLWLYVGDYFHA